MTCPPTVLDAINMTCPPRYRIHSYLRPDVRDPKRGARGSNFDRGVGGGGGDGNEPRAGEHVLEGF